MPQVRVEQVRNGQHPSEVVVSIRMADGQSEKLVVDRRSIQNDMLEVGYPVGADNDRLLVELPRESVRGVWRIWVARNSVVQEATA